MTTSSGEVLAPASATPMVVEIAKIRPSKVALRGVNKQDPQYQELVDSVRQRGVLLPILLRKLIDRETNEEFYGLVDGLQRFTASQDCGRSTINANVIEDMTDAAVLENQLVLNAIRVETKPGEFTKQLVRIFQADPLLTLADMAAKLNRSPGWIQDRLGLAKLNDKVLKLIDDEKIPLANAYALAKMEESDMNSDEWIQNAMTMSPSEFAPTATTRSKEVRDAKRQGRKPGESSFTPVKHFQKMPDVEQEIAGRAVGSVIIEAELGANPDPIDVWTLALQWVLHQDKASIEAAKAKFEAKQAALKAEREKRKADREAAKNAAATQEAVAATA